MGATVEINSIPKVFPSCKTTAVESNLQQTLTIFKELVIEFQELHSENQKYRSKYLMRNENSESQTCKTCEELRQNISIKDEILESVVSALNKLSRTRDFNIIDTIFKLINGDNISSPKDNKCKVDEISPLKEESINDISLEESVSEIEGTPGRKSPIIQSKKLKTNTTHSLSLKDKKKCPESWPTPEKKCIKLSYPTPTRNKPLGRLKQARLNLVKMKTTSVVDLTCSPELGRSYSEVNMQCNIKKEVLENDDTILPSPTSGPIVQLPIFKSSIKESPSKFIKPSSFSKIKMELENNDRDTENKCPGEVLKNEVEESINLLKQYPNRFRSPLKLEDKLNDETHCPDESISLLQHVKKIDEKIKKVNSPNKRPLVENMNLMNTQKLPESQSSMSILQDIGHIEAKTEICKRTKCNIEPVYKEPVLRKKAEKRALPGWSCEECKNFYDELYKDDLDMLAKKMDECSKHRGRNNPIRPKTPDGFWNPRWDVPQDTEEFNLRNNAM
ncbi:uncharacterized protein LOC124534410 isoform X2 [Vanessa cardui]|uniref:uncharacterized protein LOC124534410 isoform X2 n=1 Tax=Vanessa cardui TaxID=171605 RepID=UPI001F1496D4|nr:uncharacterized protein LOC124534410 isoform X2 [Vanessa cardui]